MNTTFHQPVLLDEVVQVLAPRAGMSYLDGTAGYGGHAAAIIERINPNGRAILVDRDINAVKALAARWGDRVEIIHTSFDAAADRLLEDGSLVDLILLDLGVSSPQLDNAERGFSFRTQAPLDMRMDQSQRRTAAEIVNGSDERTLAKILRDYGEEPRANAVARAIVNARPLSTTIELAKVVRRAAASTKDVDNATRSFQAIRIATNDELGQLGNALPKLVKLLAPGGKLAVISFHSLEDRIVKQFFETESRDCICPPKQPVCTCGHVASLVKLTKRPIVADDHAIAINPRARSAKLRAAEKQHQNKRRP
jgi:16S rRNA (cytosine1402-N4)-methyltransferase